MSPDNPQSSLLLCFTEKNQDKAQHPTTFHVEKVENKKVGFLEAKDALSPWDRRHHLPDFSSNSTAPNPTQQKTLVLQTQPCNSNPNVQMLEAQDEIVPGDIRYRLEPLVLAPLQMQLQHSSSQPFKHRWLPFSRTYGERFMPWKTEPKIYHGVKPYHSGAFQSPGQLPVLGSTNPAENSKKPELQPSLLNSPSGNVWLQGEHNMTTPHQISFQSPPLGLSILPVHMQSRKVAPIVRRGHAEYPNQQYQSDFQAPPWSQVLTPDPDKRSHRIDKYIQHVQKGTVGGQHCTAGVHQQPSWSQREMAILDGKCVAKFDGNTVTKMSYLPSLKPLVKRVKGKFHSNTLGVFKDKFQTETTSKQFFQDWGAQPHVLQEPHYRGNEKLLGSQAPAEDATTWRTTYMPLFTERLKLCKPKVNGIKSEASNFSTGHRKSFRPAPKLGSQNQDIRSD
ncbi:hypothetical protein H1C71_010204 [Ictidomys tridecemlineatus]|nr:hypothetical protein H1C71_010204 [Ictidomys tridecemlineatus]KAG3286600.1 hypothetical protein H1C71_010204 [Ictidomys tridecemlineatus]